MKEPAPLGDKCKVLDAVSDQDSADCVDQKKLKDEIIASGGTYVAFNKALFCADPKKSCFEHGKMIVSDKTAVLVSTGNFNDTNLCDLSLNPSKCNRDFSVVDRDEETISFLEGIFENDVTETAFNLQDRFTEASAKSTSPVTIAEKVTVSPLSLDPMNAFIQSATKTLDIENQYLKEPTMNQAIMDAAKRGVKVRIMVASECSFGKPSASDIKSTTTLMTAFETAGVEVRMFPSQLKINGKPGYLHAKAMVADGARAWVGSVNGSTAATSNNREFGLFFSTEKQVNSLQTILQSDIESPDSETWQESLQCQKDQSDLSGNPDNSGE